MHTDQGEVAGVERRSSIVPGRGNFPGSLTGRGIELPT